MMSEEKKIIIKHLSPALVNFDADLFASALQSIAESLGGVTALSKATGLTRAGLYKIMKRERNPEFATIQKILKAFDLKLTIS